MWIALALAIHNGMHSLCNKSIDDMNPAVHYVKEYELFLRNVHSVNHLLHISHKSALCLPLYDETVDLTHRNTIDQAYRQMAVLLPRTSSESCHRLHITVNTLSNNNILAEAWPANMSGPNIRVFQSALLDADLLFHVAQHEFFHIVGFNANPDAFYSRINQKSDTYTSSAVQQCLSKYENANGNEEIRVHKDNGYTMHWDTSGWFDLMTPFVTKSSHLHPCSVVTAAEASPFVSEANVCLTSDDCERDNYICSRLTSTNPHVCLPLSNATDSIGSPVKHKFPVFTSFFVSLVFLFKQLLVCAHVHNTPCASELRGD